MPFSPAEQLPADPTLRVYFSGLMIIEPSADGRSCEVFVHRSAPDHHLTIELRRKRPGRPDEIMMRHVGPLSFHDALPGAASDRPLHGFFIQKIAQQEGGAGAAGVRRYVGPATEEGAPLALAIDMDGEQFHAGSAGPVDQLGGRPSIYLDDATFYTAETTRPELDITLKRPGAADRRLEPFASLIGANVYLEDDTTIVVRWRQQGRNEAIQLTRPAAGVSYELYVINDPLYEHEDPEEPPHDEFREYYKILPAVPTGDQFRLDCPPPEAGGERGSTRTPCMPIIKGGGD